MKTHTYVNRINRAVALIKEGHAQGISANMLNAEWTGRKDTILDLALTDNEISSDDYTLICGCVCKCTKQLESIIF